MNDLVSFLFVAQTTTLIITSLLLAYPVLAYSRNVAYTYGLVLLSAAFVVFTATYVLSFIFDYPVLSSVLDLVTAVLAALGTWQFARPFIDTGGGDVQTTTSDQATGGFESAGDD